MACALRLEVTPRIYHVWNRGGNRGDIVFDDRDRQYFVDLLAEVVRRHGWVIHQFLLMTKHFHLVIGTTQPTLSLGMQWFQQKFVQHINRRYDRVGPLFQGRFEAQLVESGSYFLEILRYVAVSPVRAHVVERSEEYPWSSDRCLAGRGGPE